MTTHSLQDIQSLVQVAKAAKSQHLQNALATDREEIADTELLLAESLAAVEAHAQIALVRFMRLQNRYGNLV